jgi:hypothetical protein
MSVTTQARVAGESNEIQLVPPSWKALVAITRDPELTGVSKTLKAGRYELKLRDVQLLKYQVRVQYEYERGSTAIYVYFEYMHGRKDDVLFDDLMIQINAPGVDVIEEFESRTGLGIRVNPAVVGSMIDTLFAEERKKAKRVQARVAGETRSIDVNGLQAHLEREDSPDDDAGYKQYKRQTLDFVNIGKVKFTTADNDYAAGRLKWVSFYASASNDVKARFSINFKTGKATTYECALNYHGKEVVTKKPVGDVIKIVDVEALFTALKPKMQEKISTLLDVPSSCVIGKYTLYRNLRTSSRGYVRYDSREADSEGTPMIQFSVNIEDRNCVMLAIGGSEATNDESSRDITEGSAPAAVRTVMSRKYNTFADLIKAINGNAWIVSLVNNATKQVGGAQRVIQLNVVNETPVFDDEDPENLFDSDNDFYVSFETPAQRDSALEALRKAITDNGGKVIGDKYWKPTP